MTLINLLMNLTRTGGKKIVKSSLSENKISKISKLSIIEIENVENKITKPIIFLSGIHIPGNKWILAENMVKDIDNKDTPYVAFSLFYKCKIWSGDKVLGNGCLLYTSDAADE